MPDETKPTDQKLSLEAPKDIEDLLKDLPKISSPKPSPLVPSKPLTPLPPSTPKPPSPLLLPPQPAPPSFKPLSPEPPKPTLTPPKPTTPPVTPPTQSNQQDKFKSLIRTMAEDLESAKKGVRPESKPFEIKPPPGSPKTAPAQPPIKTPPTPSEIRLGPAQRARSLELPKPKAPFTDISRAKKSPALKIIIFILGIGIVFAGVWYFIVRQKEVTTVIPPATPTPAPTQTPKMLSELIPLSSQITISSTENFLTALNNKIKTLTLTSGGWRALNIVNENGTEYTLSQIFQRLNITLPNGILENLDPAEWTLSVYGQQEMYDSKGALSFNPILKPKLGLIAKTNYPSSLRSALNNWEITMADGFKNVFEIDTQKALTQTFLDNIYNGTGIRYRNFSYPDNSIDYAILNLSKSDSNYLILTNSRESIYSATDLLQNQ